MVNDSKLLIVIEKMGLMVINGEQWLNNGEQWQNLWLMAYGD